MVINHVSKSWDDCPRVDVKGGKHITLQEVSNCLLWCCLFLGNMNNLQFVENSLIDKILAYWDVLLEISTYSIYR